MTNVRSTLKVSFPLGEAPVQVDAQGQALLAVAIQEKDENRMLSAYTADGRLVLSNMVAETVFLTGETTVVRTDYTLPDAPASASKILIDNTFQNLFVADKTGHIHYYAINNPQAGAFSSKRECRVIRFTNYCHGVPGGYCVFGGGFI